MYACECIDLGYYFDCGGCVCVSGMVAGKIAFIDYNSVIHFGLSKVKVTTAGGEVVIRFLETKVAETIAESLKTKINEVASEEKLQNQTEAQEEA